MTCLSAKPLKPAGIRVKATVIMLVGILSINDVELQSISIKIYPVDITCGTLVEGKRSENVYSMNHAKIKHAKTE